VVGGHEGRCRPPGARRQLAEALSLVALDPEKRPRIPLIYALDQLAQRWSTSPDVLEDMDPEWLIRGLEFMRLEGAVKVTKGG
jgi:hypothetical protein